MPPTERQTDAQWAEISALKDTMAKRNESTARLEEQIKPVVSFVEKVRDGNCPMGVVHTAQIQVLEKAQLELHGLVCPIVEEHNDWKTEKRAIRAGAIIAAFGWLLSILWSLHISNVADNRSNSAVEAMRSLDQTLTMMQRSRLGPVEGPQPGLKPVPPKGYVPNRSTP
jgi:hypothetical protein